MVNVEGISAACANLNCDYLYVDSTALITGQSLSGNILTITGTNLPTDLMDVRVGRVGCGPTTGTATSITCTLTKGAAAGTYSVEVVTVEGIVPVDTGVATPIIVALDATSLSPSAGLNQFGGDSITIQGSGLSTSTSDVSVSFSDGTACNVISSTDTEV